MEGVALLQIKPCPCRWICMVFFNYLPTYLVQFLCHKDLDIQTKLMAFNGDLQSCDAVMLADNSAWFRRK
jgi:hypothetical protein